MLSCRFSNPTLHWVLGKFLGLSQFLADTKFIMYTELEGPTAGAKNTYSDTHYIHYREGVCLLSFVPGSLNFPRALCMDLHFPEVAW